MRRIKMYYTGSSIMGREYWYGTVKKMCRRYGEEISNLQELIYNSAIEQTIDEIQRQKNGDVKMRVIRMVLFDNTHTPQGAALEVNYSEDTVYPWISDFIKRVGHKAGY
jgi:hypothetical protein